MQLTIGVIGAALMLAAAFWGVSKRKRQASDQEHMKTRLAEGKRGHFDFR